MVMDFVFIFAMSLSLLLLIFRFLYPEVAFFKCELVTFFARVFSYLVWNFFFFCLLLASQAFFPHQSRIGDFSYGCFKLGVCCSFYRQLPLFFSVAAFFSRCLKMSFSLLNPFLWIPSPSKTFFTGSNSRPRYFPKVTQPRKTPSQPSLPVRLPRIGLQILKPNPKTFPPPLRPRENSSTSPFP